MTYIATARPMIAAQMSGKYSSIRFALLRFRRRHRATKIFRRFNRAALRPTHDKAIDGVDARREYDGVDQHKQHQRCRDTGSKYRRSRIRGAQDAVHDPGLTPAFGHDPAGNHSDESNPPAVGDDLQEPTRLEQFAPPQQ